MDNLLAEGIVLKLQLEDNGRSFKPDKQVLCSQFICSNQLALWAR